MSIMILRISFTIVVLVIAMAGSAVGSAFGQTFEGKTIRLVVNSPVGNPADLTCRQVAPFIAKSIPGKPTIIVENRPGAGGVAAANSFFNATKGDGLTISCFGAIPLLGLIGGDNVRFDIAKFQHLGAVAQTQLLLARNDLKISAPRDLLNPAVPLILGDTAPSTNSGMANRLFLNMIGAAYRYVTGFAGQAQLSLALTRGEISLANTGLTPYLALRETIHREGLFDAILQRGELNLDGAFRRNRFIAEIPTMAEAIAELNPAALDSVEFRTYRLIVGTLITQQNFMLPPATDHATVRLFRRAVEEAFNDPQVKDLFREKLKMDYDFVDGPTAEAVSAQLRSAYNADPRIAALMNQLMTRK